MSKQKLLISFSGGRTSAFMTWWLLNYKRDVYEMIVVFANTGKERQETLDFVANCDKYFGFNTIWVEAKVHKQKGVGTGFSLVDYKTADRSGRIFEEHISKYGIPNQNAPQCSREMKNIPIRKYAKSIGWKNYLTALGIRSDEPSRLDWNKKKREKILYFAELFHVVKSDVNLFWSKQPFDLELKSFEGNCDLCYKKSKRKLLTILKQHPEFANWWKEMEDKYSEFDPRGKGEAPYNFYRNNLSVIDLLEESKFKFDEAIDESKLIDMYKQMSLWDEEMDSNGGCVESCEAF